MDLTGLEDGVDGEQQVVDAQADDLDHAGQAQRVPEQQQLVDEAEEEQRRVHGHRVARRHLVGLGGQVVLHGEQDIAADLSVSH